MNLKQAARDMRANEQGVDRQQVKAIQSLQASVKNQADFARKNIHVAWRQNG